MLSNAYSSAWNNRAREPHFMYAQSYTPTLNVEKNCIDDQLGKYQLEIILRLLRNRIVGLIMA